MLQNGRTPNGKMGSKRSAQMESGKSHNAAKWPVAKMRPIAARPMLIQLAALANWILAGFSQLAARD